MIKGFRHVCIAVKDLNASRAFYRDILGLREVRMLTVKGAYLEKVFDRKGVVLTYVKMRDRHQPKHIQPVFELHHWEGSWKKGPKYLHHISFTVDDLDAEYRRLKRRGVDFISAPVISPDGRTKICFAYDPDRVLIEFIEDIRGRRR